MKKKILAIVLAVVFTLSIVPMPVIHMHEARANAVSVGEIIQFGGRDWRVLDVQGNYAKLLHETVITGQPYHHWEHVTWETSTSRAWLNGEFLNNFSEVDRARIRETYVINSDNPWTWPEWGRYTNTPGGANTRDRIFLLSIDEVLRYFGDSGMVARGVDPNQRTVWLWANWVCGV